MEWNVGGTHREGCGSGWITHEEAIWGWMVTHEEGIQDGILVVAGKLVRMVCVCVCVCVWGGG